MATQTEKGKAFEYACLTVFENKLKEINEDRLVLIEENAPYKTAKSFYEELCDEEQKLNLAAAKTAVNLILPLEPKLEYGNEILILSLNADNAGETGDVRDLLCLKTAESWEIGFSCKHNHEALKHPRLTKDADFGTTWIGKPCSDNFKSKIAAIRTQLPEEKTRAKLWKNIDNKFDNYYVPILEAFKEEIERLCSEDPDTCAELLKYFFGCKDFYKIISLEKDKQTKIEGFNMYGTMNKHEGPHKPITKVRQLKLPTRLLNIDIVRKTTLLVAFDKGWTISMRLHNKDEKATITSLAWDVKLAGMPPELYQQQSPWD